MPCQNSLNIHDQLHAAAAVANKAARHQDGGLVSVKTWTSGSVSEPVLGSRAGEGKSPVTIHQWKILCSHMLPLKAASFPHFASRWGCLKRAGRVLKVLINRGTSNMFGKDLHFHTGTLNYYNIPNPLLFASSFLLFPNC